MIVTAAAKNFVFVSNSYMTYIQNFVVVFTDKAIILPCGCTKDYCIHIMVDKGSPVDLFFNKNVSLKEIVKYYKDIVPK